MNSNKTGLKRSSFPLLTIIMAVFVLTLFSLPTASASFTLGSQNYFIGKVYGPSSNVTGWLNISFGNEPLNSFFNDSRGNSINLSEILKQNIDYSYSCSPVDCSNDYFASNGEQTKTFTLNSGESKIYGIKLTGYISSIDSINFSLDSDASASCMSQVGIDFLADSSVDSMNTNPLDSGTCTSLLTYGCFNPAITPDETIISTSPYCEKLNLSVSPGFFIGAWIKKVSGSEIINASLYNSAGVEVARCSLPDATTGGGEVLCGVNYSVTQTQEAYVCIRAVGGNIAGSVYKTHGYSIPNGCGFPGTPIPSSMPGAYQIFAQGKRFDAVGSISVNKSLSDMRSLAELAQDYITNKYTNMNCSAGCVIPIKINSNLDQEGLTLRNLQVRYTKDIGPVTESNFYDISTVPAKVSSIFQKLYLDNAGFSIPSSLGNYSFSLKLDNQNIISQKLQVMDIPVINLVTPLKTASAFPTQFTASVNSAKNLTNFFWDFGDNSTTSTPANHTTHTYGSVGIYNLMINVTDQRGLGASKIFVINVTSPKDLINSNLNDIQNSISNLEMQIASYPGFDQQVLNSSMNLSDMQGKIGYLRAAYQNASSNADYNAIVAGLLGINIPDGISETGKATHIPLISGTSTVNLNVLQDIGGGNYTAGREKDYTNAIFSWQQENLNANFDFEDFSGRYQGYLDPIAKTFKFTFSPKKDIPYNYYLIIPQLDGFQADSNFSTKDGYNYINLKNKQTVSFSTTENIDPTNLQAFISPALTQLTVTQTLPEQTKLSKWVIFAGVIIGLLILAIIVYMLLRSWYDKRYENYLFKNKNDLYNMVNYVNNAKTKGLKNNEIEENLKKAGWSGERVRYVMRKYAGKRTGLL